MTANQQFWLWIGGSAAGAAILGLAGLRSAAVRKLLVGLAPLYSVALFVYGLFRGGPNDCVTAPSPPGYVCHPTSFMSDIGWYGVLIVTTVTVVSLSSIAAGLTRTRTPSVLGAIVLLVLIALFPTGLLLWVPAEAALIAAAVAGPPGRRGQGATAEPAAIH